MAGLQRLEEHDRWSSEKEGDCWWSCSGNQQGEGGWCDERQ